MGRAQLSWNDLIYADQRGLGRYAGSWGIWSVVRLYETNELICLRRKEIKKVPTLKNKKYLPQLRDGQAGFESTYYQSAYYQRLKEVNPVLKIKTAADPPVNPALWPETKRNLFSLFVSLHKLFDGKITINQTETT